MGTFPNCPSPIVTVFGYQIARFACRFSSGTNGRCSRRRRRESIQFAIDDDLVAVSNVVSIELLVRIQHFFRSILRLHYLVTNISGNIFYRKLQISSDGIQDKESYERIV